MLAQEICLAMARTNRWEWTGWGGQIRCRSITSEPGIMQFWGPHAGQTAFSGPLMYGWDEIDGRNSTKQSVDTQGVTRPFCMLLWIILRKGCNRCCTELSEFRGSILTSGLIQPLSKRLHFKWWRHSELGQVLVVLSLAPHRNFEILLLWVRLVHLGDLASFHRGLDTRRDVTVLVCAVDGRIARSKKHSVLYVLNFKLLSWWILRTVSTRDVFFNENLSICCTWHSLFYLLCLCWT